MKKYLLLLALVCLLGNGVQAQNGFYATETIDFTGWSYNPNDYNRAYTNVSWSNNRNNITSISSTDGNISLTRTYTGRFSLNNDGSERWRMWGSGTFQVTYLQRDNSNTNFFFYLHDMKEGDVVTIWGENGDATGEKGCRVQNNSNRNGELMQFNEDNPDEGQQFVVASDGDVTLQFFGQYSGIRKITIKSRTSHFDYDPGFEDYDMYDEFSDNDPKKCYSNERENGKPYTSYSLSDEETGIEYNDGHIAKYIVLSNSKISANNRIAIDPSAGTWRFNYGLRAPDPNVAFNNHDNEKWANFSICNLKEGDRVVFSYTGTAPVFSSVAGGADAPTGPYNGSKAFFDQYNDGQFDEGEDVYITPGATPETDWSRPEGNFYKEDHDCNQGDYVLYYTRYVITEDGHLDLAIAPDTRIVHIKIYSDHQASMVDEYDANWYTAKFDITGELQANEHIMPGGLEVHVGSSDASQHAHVVSSAHGPVSIVNAVDGFKLPGMSRGDNGELQFVFDLANNIPETGTFYKFMPLEDGKMKLTFQAANMNYYTYGLNGDETYVGDLGSYGDNTWLLEWDRPNEQTVNVNCPYYLVKIDKNGNKTVTTYNNIGNGAERTTPEINVLEGETYYLYGGWNGDVSQLSYTRSGQGNNNIEYFPYGAGNGGAQKACGVARLMEVDFNPNKKIYPLAKWVPNGTDAVKTGSGVPNPDTFETEYDLADLYGYNEKTSITVKKMSGNITACHPFIQKVQDENNHYKLMIDGITFANSKDQGGTILIKIGDATIKNNPVYTLTIAYSTDPLYDGNEGRGARGYSWDFSSNSLNGLKYEPALIGYKNDQNQIQNDKDSQHDIPVYTHNAAQPQDYGHYFTDYFAADISQYSSADDVFTKLEKSGSGLLYDEIHAEGTHSRNSDWVFNYNLVNAGNLYDPVFLNKYDVDGDNADLIWETEGTVIKASANSSVMFNEFTGGNIHSSEKDPDRYVGIKEGSEFRIPWLMPNDRVIIWMGTGKGAFNDHVVFNIRGAYDAVHNVISPTDDYIVGGSHWNVVKNEKGQVVTNDPYYRGCYHFFAQGHNGGPADMVFKMVGGNLCKIYKIQIYRGDRIITNEIVGATENDNKYFLWSRAYDPNDSSDKAVEGGEGYTAEGYTDTHNYNWALKYLGKDQQLANGTGKNSQENEIIAKTGKYNSTTPALTNNFVKVSQVNTETGETEEIATSKVESFTYKHKLGEIGTFRMRGKDMEKSMNYVADYADHNVTIAYQETQKYPYTWDFTDVTGIADNITNLFTPEEQLGESTTAPAGVDATAWAGLAETSYQKTARDLSLWEVTGTYGNYMLRLNSQSGQTPENPMEQDNIFETAKAIGGNQVWANGTIVPEMQGVWFYTDNNNQNNGEWTIIKGDDKNVGGLDFTGTSQFFKKIVVPNVPKDAAVYLRMTKLTDGTDEPVIRYLFGEGELNQSTSATIGASTNMNFYEIDNTSDYIVAIKNTNSSKSNLTLSLNGYRIQKLAVSEDPKTVNKKGYASESHKRVLDHSLTSFFTGKNIKAYLAKNYNESASTIDLVEIKKPMPAATGNGDNVGSVLYNNDYYKDKNNVEHGQVDILDGGFHLFVPDMHDYTGNPNDIEHMKTGELEDTSGNLMLSYNAGATSNATIPQKIGSSIVYVLSYQYFEHDKDGLTVNDANEAQVEAFYRVAKNGAGIKPNSAYITFSSPSQAKVSFLWEDELFGETNNGIATGISEATNQGTRKMEWYSLDGRKLNGAPTAKGLYIVNGKKVLVK